MRRRIRGGVPDRLRFPRRPDGFRPALQQKNLPTARDCPLDILRLTVVPLDFAADGVNPPGDEIAAGGLKDQLSYSIAGHWSDAPVGSALKAVRGDFEEVASAPSLAMAAARR